MKSSKAHESIHDTPAASGPGNAGVGNRAFGRYAHIGTPRPPETTADVPSSTRLARDPRADWVPSMGVNLDQLAVQRKASATAPPTATAATVHEAAARGVAGASAPLPHAGTIQQAFGKHDIRGVRAQVGGPAANACTDIGATAYATGTTVAFASAPDLHTAAHEAAHVVQQRGGVQLKGGVGQAGDTYEQHADAVADRVVQGKSAEQLLDRVATGSPSLHPAIQKKKYRGWIREHHSHHHTEWAKPKSKNERKEQLTRKEKARMTQLALRQAAVVAQQGSRRVSAVKAAKRSPSRIRKTFVGACRQAAQHLSDAYNLATDLLKPRTHVAEWDLAFRSGVHLLAQSRDIDDRGHDSIAHLRMMLRLYSGWSWMRGSGGWKPPQDVEAPAEAKLESKESGTLTRLRLKAARLKMAQTIRELSPKVALPKAIGRAAKQVGKDLTAAAAVAQPHIESALRLYPQLPASYRMSLQDEIIGLSSAVDEARRYAVGDGVALQETGRLLLRLNQLRKKAGMSALNPQIKPLVGESDTNAPDNWGGEIRDIFGLMLQEQYQGIDELNKQISKPPAKDIGDKILEIAAEVVITGFIGGAASMFSGGLVVAILGKEAKSLLEKAFADTLKDATKQVAKSSIKHRRTSSGDLAGRFIAQLKNHAIKNNEAIRKEFLRRVAPTIQRAEDRIKAASAVGAGLTSAKAGARALMIREGLQQWCDLLAQQSLGTGADKTADVSRRSSVLGGDKTNDWHDFEMGVLRFTVDLGSGAPAVKAASVQGISAELRKRLWPMRIGELRMPCRFTIRTGKQRFDISRSAAGSLTIDPGKDAFIAAKSGLLDADSEWKVTLQWLSRYGGSNKTSKANAMRGARRILAQIGSQQVSAKRARSTGVGK